MTASILPFRRRGTRGLSQASHSPFPAYTAPPPLYLDEKSADTAWADFQRVVELGLLRDAFVRDFLELRDVHLPRMCQRDRAAVQALNHFLLYGGLTECRESLKHNCGVAQRLLIKYRQPPSKLYRIGHFIRQWLWEVTQP